jgi:hypothetical protein
LAVGAAVFGFVNQQAGVSSQAYGKSNGVTVNYLQERFEPVEINFNYPNGCSSHCTSSSLQLFIYNNGNTQNNFQQIEIYNLTAGSRTKIDITYTGTYVTNINTACKVAATTSYESPILGSGGSAFSVSTGSINSVTLTLPSSCFSGKFDQGDTYYVDVLGIYGNIQTYFQVM